MLILHNDYIHNLTVLIFKSWVSEQDTQDAKIFKNLPEGMGIAFYLCGGLLSCIQLSCYALHSQTYSCFIVLFVSLLLHVTHQGLIHCWTEGPWTKQLLKVKCPSWGTQLWQIKLEIFPKRGNIVMTKNLQWIAFHLPGPHANFFRIQCPKP